MRSAQSIALRIALGKMADLDKGHIQRVPTFFSTCAKREEVSLFRASPCRGYSFLGQRLSLQAGNSLLSFFPRKREFDAAYKSAPRHPHAENLFISRIREIGHLE